MITVEPSDWQAAAVGLHEEGFTWPDWLAASDEVPRRPGEPDGFAVVVRIWSVERREEALLRTVVPRADPSLDTLTGVWPGLAWCERETAELHGVVFLGHPDPRPLLLPDDPDRPAFPLRKAFPLVARDEAAWPGATDPAGARGRPPTPHRLLP